VENGLHPSWSRHGQPLVVVGQFRLLPDWRAKDIEKSGARRAVPTKNGARQADPTKNKR
jgi:hypothetical protein